MDPHFFPALANTLEFLRDVFTPVQLRPEFTVVGALPVRFFDKHSVVLALDLFQRVTQRLQKIFVRANDGAVHLELNCRLRLADGGDLAGIVQCRQLLLGRIGGEFDYLGRLAVSIENGIVGSLDPHFFPALANTLELIRDVFTPVQLCPELAIVGALPVRFFNKQAVVFVFDLFQCVTQRLQKILVRGNDGAVHLELNHRLRFADGGDLCVQFNLRGFDANRFRDDFPGRHRP